MKVEGIQHPNSKKVWLEYLPERCEGFDRSQKKTKTLDNGYLWRYVNLHAGCWYLQEDVMVADNHKGNFDLKC